MKHNVAIKPITEREMAVMKAKAKLEYLNLWWLKYNFQVKK